MSRDSEKSREPTPAGRAAADAEIRRLIDNPPAKRPREPDAFERSVSVGDVAERWMQKAMRHTGMSREEIEAEWQKIDLRKESSRPPGLTPEQRRARDADMPLIYRQSVIDKPPTDCRPLRRVKAFLASQQRILVLNGGKGTWKTGSACYAIGQVEGSRFVDARTLVRMHIEQRERFDVLLRAPLVVLDDLGREKKIETGAFIVALDELMDNAYLEMKRLIVTANLGGWETFREEPEKGGYGSRLAERIIEVGSWYDVTGESRRPQMRIPSHWSEEREPGCDDE